MSGAEVAGEAPALCGALWGRLAGTTAIWLADNLAFPTWGQVVVFPWAPESCRDRRHSAFPGKKEHWLNCKVQCRTTHPDFSNP